MKGIYVKNSPSIVVAENYCFWPYWDDYYESSGIELYNSSNTVLYNNTCLLNRYGIKAILSDFLIIQSNSCNFNYGPGLVLQDSTNAIIFANVFSYNDDFYYSCAYCPSSLLYGVFLSNVNSSSIYSNEFISNGYYGLFIDSQSSNNLIYTNSFVNNYVKWVNNCLYIGCEGESYSQASDDGIANEWFSTSLQKGNFWNEFSNVGYYTINGFAEQFDEIPLDENMNPINNNPSTDSVATTIATDDTTNPDGPMDTADDASFSFVEVFVSFSLILTIIIKKKAKGNDFP
jgi:parallel beta-helix repeat protein